MLARRRKIDDREQSLARQYLHQLRALVDEVDSQRVFGAILDLANKYSLSVYDATYLEVSLRKNLPLASRDDALNRAAKAAGIECLG
jgi:predicted nucleic acid-binding protein